MGSSHPDQILKNTTLAKPDPNPTKTDNEFVGWYTDSALTMPYIFSSPVTASLNLYAKWVTEPPAEITVTNGSTLEDKLDWLKDNARSNAIYTVEVNADEEIKEYSYKPYNTLSYTGKNDITIKLVGIGEERVISARNDIYYFIIETGVTLILDNNITLKGVPVTNGLAIVRVNSGGSLVMNTGSKITGGRAIAYGSPGGGVAVYGTFTMNGGEISDCICYSRDAMYGGGVYVAPNRTFIMNDGKITGNNAYRGGGVYVDENAIFTMNGGEISDSDTAFIGQYTSYIGYGGGVHIASNGTFTMNNGKISGNKADYGGGVSSSGTFTMNGGEISGNTAHNNGGGVSADGTFTKNGGTIYGYDENDTTNSNVVQYYSGTVMNNRGHAVSFYFDDWFNNYQGKYRDTTAGPETNLDSAKDNTEGGWEGIF